jgi:hypothetical protein
MEVFAAYGNKCACCPETEPKFLSIDHIDGAGNQHRLEVFGNKNVAGLRFYSWLRRNNFPPGFQLLCFNCNLAKGHWGICPHKATKE